MPRLADYTVKCEGCDELVEPVGATKRLRYALVGLFLLGVAGVLAGTSIGIATAGAGIAATIPLGLIGAYIGWKIGAGWARFRDGVNCPECGYVFGGRGELSLPAGGELSLPSLGKWDSQSNESSEEGGSANRGTGGEDDHAFHIEFTCSNCGLEWANGFYPGEEIVDAAEVDRGDGVIIIGEEDSKRLVCPTCNSEKSVEVLNRNPSGDVSNNADEPERSLWVRALDVAVYTGLSTLLAFGAAFTIAAAEIQSSIAFMSFIFVLLGAVFARSALNIRIVE